MAPNLHWPDTMFSYDHGTGVMYTCDGECRRKAAGGRWPSTAWHASCPTLPPPTLPSPPLLQPLACTTAPRTRLTASWRRWSRTTASTTTASCEERWALLAVEVSRVWVGLPLRRCRCRCCTSVLMASCSCSCCRLPNAKSVTTALRKVKDLPYSVIANGHGPLLRFNVPEMVGRWVGCQGHQCATSLRVSDAPAAGCLSLTCPAPPGPLCVKVDMTISPPKWRAAL